MSDTRVTPRIRAVVRGFLSQRVIASHVAAILGGLGLSSYFYDLFQTRALLLAGPIIVYAAWFVYCIPFSSRDGRDAEDVVRRDGFTYLPFVLLPIFKSLNLRWCDLVQDRSLALFTTFSLLVVGKALFSRHDVGGLIDRRWRWGTPWGWFTAFLTATYIAIFARASYVQFENFDDSPSYFDLAHYDQAAWNTIHGRILEYTFSDGRVGVQMSRLGTHVDPIHLLFSFFYFLHSGPETLLLLQSMAIGLACWPLYLFTKRLTESDFMAFVACLAFLLNPAIQNGNLSQFHAVSAAPLCLFSLFHAVQAKQWRIFWIALALTLACKENLALTTFVVGLWMWKRGDRRIGLATSALSLVYFIFCEKVVIPHFLGGSPTIYLTMFYRRAGGSFAAIFLNFVKHPVAAFSQIFTLTKLHYVDELFSSFGYLPLFAPITFILAVPELMTNLLSDSPHMHSLHEHYNFVTVPMLLLIVVFALEGIREKLMQWRSPKGALLSNISVALGLFLIIQSVGMNRITEPLPLGHSLQDLVTWTPPEHTRIGERMMSWIPQSAPVSTSVPLASHLSQRRQIYLTPFIGNAEYVLSDIGNISESLRSGDPEFDLLSRLKKSRQFQLIAEADGLFLWRRDRYPRRQPPRPVFDFDKRFTLLGQEEVLNDPAVSLATKALQEQIVGLKPFRSGNVATTGGVLRGPALIVINLNEPRPPLRSLQVIKYVLAHETPPSSEGYLIRSQTIDVYPCLLVAARSRLGLAYGLFRLVDDLKGQAGARNQAWDIDQSPALSLRLMSTAFASDAEYDDPATALRFGYNTVRIPMWPSLVTYRQFDHRIYGGKANVAALASVRQQQDRARSLIQRAKALHLKIFTMGDMFMFPRTVFKLYGPQLRHEGSEGDTFSHVVCAGRELPWRLVSAAFDELFTDFPGIDYVMARTGENYPAPFLQGSVPSFSGCSLCRDLDYVGMLQKTINFARAQIVDVHHRKYIHRAWDLSTGGFHSNPQVYDEVFSGLDDTRGLIISLKHSETDFWRYNRLNPSLGRGNVPQIVEVECAREYEGKGAYPNYLGDIFGRGAPEVTPRRGLIYAYSCGVAGGWAWAKGGGWGGPHLKTNLWLDANVYATGRLMWDPFLSPTQVAREWATATFGFRAAPTVTQILMNSDDAALASGYFSEVTPSLRAWSPTMTWTRDDVICGMAPLASLYRKCSSRQKFNAIVDDQHLAVRYTDRFVRKFRKVRGVASNPVTAQQAYDSLLYMQSLYRLRMCYVCGTLYYLKWGESRGRDTHARDLALRYLQRWRQEWRRHETEIARLPWAATPYRSAGMVEDCEFALNLLKHPPARSIRLDDLIRGKSRRMKLPGE